MYDGRSFSAQIISMKKNIKFFKKQAILILLIVGSLVVFIFRNQFIDYIYISSIKLGYNPHPDKVFIPLKYPIVGTDISRHQEHFNWDKCVVINHLSDTIQLKFLIAKATEGINYTDPFYLYHKAQSLKHPEIRFGAYHYFLPNRNPKLQAHHFIRNADLQSGNIIPIIDVEEKKGLSNEKIQERVKIFCDILEEKFGVKPIIYSNKNFLIEVLGENFQDYPIWVAHYYEKDIELPNGWDWNIWQLSDKGSTFATQYQIDIDVINGGNRQLKKLIYQPKD